jgi:hypothetical protein
VIAGGRDNLVGPNAPYALAAGRAAQALHGGAFVWADADGTPFASAQSNEFALRAGGGMRVEAPSLALVGGAFNGDGAGLSNLAGSAIQPGTIASAQLAAESVTAAAIVDGSITAAEVATNTFWSTTGNAGTTAGVHFIGTTDAQPLELRSAGGIRFGIGAGPGELMRLTPIGYLGLGTNNPAFPFHLASDAQILQELQGRNSGGTWLSLVNQSTGGRSWSLITSGASNGEGAGHLLIRDNTANAVRMMIRTNGFIGFGTTTPTNPLQMASGAYVSAGGTWTSVSDKNRKQNFEAVDPGEILAKVAVLPITKWSYTAEPGIQHIGPTAQDFHAAFGVGANEVSLSQIDPDGVALAAIQALAKENAEFKRQNAEMKRENEALKTRLNAIERRLGL